MSTPRFEFGRIPVFPPAAPPAAAPAVERPRGLDSCARLSLWGNRGGHFGSYRVCGYLGFVAGFSLVVWCGLVTGPSAPAALSFLVLACVPSSFLLGVWLSRFVHGTERIVFFEQALFVTVVCAFVTWVTMSGASVGTALDLVTLGVGTFLSFGRIGCLMVGCCHGRPARWGIRYGAAHAEAGFPWYLVGRRLFPLQLADGTVSLVLVVALLSMSRGHHPPGTLAAAYYLGYCPARFFLEGFRGDAARPRWLGLTEAQWTATLLAAAIAAWAVFAAREEAAMAAALAAALAVASAAVMISRRRRARLGRDLGDPWHIEEIHQAIAVLPFGGKAVTSRGLCISRHELPAAPGLSDYVLSLRSGRLLYAEARAVTRWLSFPSAPPGRIELRTGAAPGIFHVLVQAPSAA